MPTYFHFQKTHCGEKLDRRLNNDHTTVGWLQSIWIRIQWTRWMAKSMPVKSPDTSMSTAKTNNCRNPGVWEPFHEDSTACPGPKLFSQFLFSAERSPFCRYNLCLAFLKLSKIYLYRPFCLLSFSFVIQTMCPSLTPSESSCSSSAPFLLLCDPSTLATFWECVSLSLATCKMSLYIMLPTYLNCTFGISSQIPQSEKDAFQYN